MTNSVNVASLGAAMVANSSGNVGIGVTPNNWLSIIDALQIGTTMGFATNQSNAVMANNVYYETSSYKYITTNYATYYEQNTGTHRWYYAASGTAGADVSFTESMRVDTSGNLLINTTSPTDNSRLAVSQTDNKACIAALTTSAGGSAVIRVQTSQSSMTAMYMLTGGGGTVAGIISSSGSSTTYGTSSDYRLKENITPMTGALDKVSKLKPITYKWKADGIDGQGFIAHELAEVCPDAVVGEKDAVNEDGTIKPQAIDPSKLVATLTAAMQEQQAIIEELKARIVALEAK